MSPDPTTADDPLADLGAPEPKPARAAAPRMAAASRRKPKAEPKAAPAPRIGGGNGQGGRPSNAALRAKIQGSIETWAGAYVMAGIVKGDPHMVYDAKVVAYRAPALAAELFDLSRKYEPVRKALEALYSASGTASSLAVLAGTVLPILANHGVFPADLFDLPGVGRLLPPEAEVGPMPPPKVRQPRAPKQGRPAASTAPPEPDGPDLDVAEPEHAPADDLPVAPPGRGF